MIFASVTRTCVQKVLMVSHARVTANVIVILENVDVKKVLINSNNPFSYNINFLRICIILYYFHYRVG